MKNNYSKKKTALIFAVFFIVSALAGSMISCNANPNNDNLTTTLTTAGTNGTTANLNTTGTSITPVIKTDTGSFVSKTNNNTIQVKLENGTTKEYTLSVNFVANFESMALKKDDKVKVSYYDQAGGLPIVTNIDKT